MECSMFGLSQSQEALLSNAFSHWPTPYPEKIPATIITYQVGAPSQGPENAHVFVSSKTIQRVDIKSLISFTDYTWYDK